MPVFFKDVKNDMAKFPRDPSDYPRLDVKSLEFTAAPGINSLTYKAQVLGETDTYLVYIQWFKVDFSEDKDATHELPAKGGDKLVYYTQPRISGNPVFMKCSCPDFRFTWEKQLYDGKGLLGNWRRYTRVTPPSGRPPRNPKNVEGFCKHIYNLLGALRDAGQIKE